MKIESRRHYVYVKTNDSEKEFIGHQEIINLETGECVKFTGVSRLDLAHIKILVKSINIPNYINVEEVSKRLTVIVYRL